VHRPTIKDVAQRAKVSLKTVSRVINNEASVRGPTRDRVQRAIEELKYEPDQSARSLRTAMSYAIGLVYDNPNPYYVISVQNGVLAACRDQGFGLQIHPCDSTVPDLADELHELVRRARLAGLVLAPPMSERMELIRFLAGHDCFENGESSNPAIESSYGTSMPLDFAAASTPAAISSFEPKIAVGRSRSANNRRAPRKPSSNE
jgi:hypothetical protein